MNQGNQGNTRTNDTQKAAAVELMLRRKRKRLFLIILLLILAALAYAFLSYFRTKEVPLPNVTDISDEQAVPPTFLFVFDGGMKHKLKKPVGVSIHPESGNVYVTDTYNSRISVFDPQGTYQFSFNKIGEYGNLYRPLYVEFDKKGNVYITDRKRPGIYIFAEDGKFIKKFLPNGDANFSWTPIAMKFAANGDLIVSDVRDVHRILVFNSEGSLKFSFGKTGQVDKISDDPGLFAYPNSIDIDPKGNIVIADSNNRRLQVYSQKGEFVKIIDSGGLPRGIKWGYKNRLHMVDVVGHNVMIFKDDYKHIATFGEKGQELGQFWFPTGIDVKGRRIYVADTENSRIEVWSWGVEVAVPRQVARGIDLMKILGPLALLLLLLWLRRRRHVSEEKFIELIIEINDVKWVKDKFKKLYVTREVYDKFKDIKVDEIDLEDMLKVWKPKKDLVARLEEEFYLSTPEAQAVALAKGRFFKPWLLTENERIRQVAESLGISAFDYKDLKGGQDDEPSQGSNG